MYFLHSATPSGLSVRHSHHFYLYLFIFSSFSRWVSSHWEVLFVFFSWQLLQVSCCGASPFVLRCFLVVIQHFSNKNGGKDESQSRCTHACYFNVFTCTLILGTRFHMASVQLGFLVAWRQRTHPARAHTNPSACSWVCPSCKSAPVWARRRCPSLTSRAQAGRAAAAACA